MRINKSEIQKLRQKAIALRESAVTAAEGFDYSTWSIEQLEAEYERQMAATDPEPSPHNSMSMEELEWAFADMMRDGYPN